VTLNARPDLALCEDCAGWLHTKQERQRAADAGVTLVVGVEPVFSVADVPRATAHYRRLGFGIEHHDDTYAFALRNDVTIHLTRAEHPDAHATICMHVDDAEALADEWRAAGIDVGPLVDTDYGKREGAHADPDGNLIRFGSPSRSS
jgi:hypothetical protein